MDRQSALLVLAVVVRVGFALWASFCLRYVYLSFKRGHVFINGKSASRNGEPLGFWLVVISIIAVSVLSGWVVLFGL